MRNGVATNAIFSQQKTKYRICFQPLVTTLLNCQRKPLSLFFIKNHMLTTCLIYCKTLRLILTNSLNIQAKGREISDKIGRVSC